LINGNAGVSYLTRSKEQFCWTFRKNALMIGELAALGAAISWTASAVLYKKALTETKPISANVVRLVCTSVILLLVLITVGKFGALMNLPLYGVAIASISGIIGLGFGDTLYMASLKRIGVARAVPITCTYPLFNLLWSIFLVGQEITLPAVLGAVAIVLGIWFLGETEEADVRETQKRNLIIGVVYALVTAIAWSVSITMMDVAVTLPKGGSMDFAFAVNTIRVTAIAVPFLALSPLIDRKMSFLKISRRTLVTLIVGGIVALGVGWFFLGYSFAIKTPEARAVPISSTTPLFSTLFGIIFLHEKVTAMQVIASIVIVGGVFLIFLV
jgi:DME family drug/metabolite transporter